MNRGDAQQLGQFRPGETNVFSVHHFYREIPLRLSSPPGVTPRHPKGLSWVSEKVPLGHSEYSPRAPLKLSLELPGAAFSAVQLSRFLRAILGRPTKRPSLRVGAGVPVVPVARSALAWVQLGRLCCHP